MKGLYSGLSVCLSGGAVSEPNCRGAFELSNLQVSAMLRREPSLNNLHPGIPITPPSPERLASRHIQGMEGIYIFVDPPQPTCIYPRHQHDYNKPRFGN